MTNEEEGLVVHLLLPPVGQQQLPVQLIVSLGSFHGADLGRRGFGFGPLTWKTNPSR